MGELARRRSARDLWISRGHLWAIATGAVLLTVVAFSLGVSAGRADGAIGEQDRLGPAPDDQLVTLLARVEASMDPTGGVRELTFPDALLGVDVVLDVPKLPEGEATVTTIPAEVPRP